ncbi:MAG: hypothetical protein CV088_21890 [Nitrospira sp. LK70]|nr:hypothetical protein [Nitrospira sp. LK70]
MLALRAALLALWFHSLNAVASAKVTGALHQLGVGNWSNIKGVGGGIFERKLDVGPGYRMSFRKDGETVEIILLSSRLLALLPLPIPSDRVSLRSLGAC